MGPSGCCAPGCVTSKRGYEGPRPKVFHCPAASRDAWLKAIPVKWEGPKGPPKELKICEHHFEPSLIVRDRTCLDGQGNIVPMNFKPELKKGAIPTIWPELPPSYQGRAPALRESREEKEAKRQCIRAIEEENEVQRGEEADRLDSFSTLVQGLQHRFPSWKASRAGSALSQFWKSDWNESRVAFYQLDYSTDQPRVGRSIDFVNSLTPRVHVSEEKQRTQRRIDRWSSLFALLERLETQWGHEAGSEEDIYWKIGELLDRKEEILNADINSDLPVDRVADLENERTFVEIFRDQLQMRDKPKAARRFSERTMAAAMDLHARTATGYRFVKKAFGMILPAKSTLSTTAANFRCVIGTDQNRLQLLQDETKNLTGNQRMFTIEIDEIHNEKKIELKNGQLHGAAVNDGKESQVATTTLVMYIVGVFCSIRMPIVIFPVQGAGGDFVREKLEEVIESVERLGIEVLAVICDGHAMNRKAYRELLQKYGCDPKNDVAILADKNPFPKFNPLSPGPRPLFLDFDYVHILKCIRNNWIRSATGGVLYYPRKCDGLWMDQMASWVYLRRAHETEEGKNLQCMPRITGPVLDPGNYAKQNVSIALRPFSDSTTAGLSVICSENPDNFQGWEQTVYFLRLIYRWWKANNVQYHSQGIRTNDPDQAAFRSTDDDRMEMYRYLRDMLEEWIRRSTQVDSSGNKKRGSSDVGLTEETFDSFLWNVKVRLALIPYLLEERGVSYVLTGKFTTSHLEGFFGWVRQMCGAKFTVTVLEILEATKKILIISYLSVYNSTNGPVFWKKKAEDLGKIDVGNAEAQTTFFRNMLEETEYEEPTHHDMENIVYVAGYAVFKLVNKTDICRVCVGKFDSKAQLQVDAAESNQALLRKIDLGKLKYPTTDAVGIVNIVYKIVSVLTMEQFQNAFLHAENQRSVVKQLAYEVYTNEFREAAQEICTHCRLTLEKPVKKIIQTTTNTLLKNFASRRTEQHIQEASMAREKRAARKKQGAANATA